MAETNADPLQAQGDLRGARLALEPALRAHPEVYRLALRYAYLSYRLKDFETAETYYRKAAALGPEESPPREGLFYTALARKDARWQDQARALLQVEPGHLDANLRLAFDAFTAHRYAEARGFYARALVTEPGSADALTGLGWCAYYEGRYWEARGNFRRALALAPSDASARQGLALTPSPLWIGAGAYYAALGYRGNPAKKDGFSAALPITMVWTQKGSLTLTPVRTRIHYSGAPDAAQDELNVAADGALSKEVSVHAGFDRISVNDPATDGGRIYTGGFYYTRASEPEESMPGTMAVGGYVAYSRYPATKVTQLSPLVGFGDPGLYYAEVSLMRSHNSAAGEDLSAYKAALTLGPWEGISLTVKGYTGRKRLPVEDWGAVVVNGQDVYRGGWRTSLSWVSGSWTVFAVYGADRFEAAGTPPPAYDGVVAVGGAQYLFGL